MGVEWGGGIGDTEAFIGVVHVMERTAGCMDRSRMKSGWEGLA